MIRLCNFHWNSNEGKPGSAHFCALEDGHFGPHECRGAEGNCNEVHIEHETTVPAELPFHLRRDDVSGDIEFEVLVEEPSS
jgi:hypothetical protein